MNSEGHGITLSSYEGNRLGTGLAQFADWVARKPPGFAMSCLAMICCLLALAGSGFDYSIATVAASSGDALPGNAAALSWSGVIGNMLFASFASVAVCAVVLALSAWTAPQTTLEIIRPQRRNNDLTN